MRTRTGGRSNAGAVRPEDSAENTAEGDAGGRRRWWPPLRKSKRRKASRESSGQRRTERPAESHEGVAPRRWPWILAVVLVGAVLCGAVYAVFFSPLLGVTSVQITGAPDDVTAKVQAAVDVPNGTPLARVDLDQVAARVKGVPEVSAVEVARGWPDTLAVTVTPRVPVAVTSANGQLWLLDDTGDPYLAVGSPPAGLVTVQLVAPGVGDPSTAAALTVAAALTADFRNQVASISARTAFDVELTLTDGRKIVWGEATDSARKMQILPALLAAQKGTEYDITDPTLVSVR